MQTFCIIVSFFCLSGDATTYFNLLEQGRKKFNFVLIELSYVELDVILNRLYALTWRIKNIITHPSTVAWLLILLISSIIYLFTLYMWTLAHREDVNSKRENCTESGREGLYFINSEIWFDPSLCCHRCNTQ